jgi:hypothetical protein
VDVEVSLAAENSGPSGRANSAVLRPCGRVIVSDRLDSRGARGLMIGLVMKWLLSTFFLFKVKPFIIPGFPSLIGSINRLGRMGITGDQRLLIIGNDVTSVAGHRTTQQPAFRSINGEHVEYPGTHDASMHLDCISIG